MPQPSRTQVHVDRPLTDLATAFMQEESKYIAARVFPNVTVSKQSDQYFQYTRADWLRNEAQIRAPGTESAGGGFGITTDSYFCDVFAYHKDVDDQIRANADVPIQPDRDATLFIQQQLLTKREVDWINNFFVTSIWSGGDPTPGTKWDVATSNPAQDVQLQADVIESATGFRPNTLVVSNDTHSALKNNVEVLDRIRYTQRGIVTNDLLAALFEVDQYLVARAVVNSAAEGAATESTAFIGNTQQALLCYSAPSPGVMVPSAGYTFSWNGLLGASAFGNRMKRFRMEELESDRVEGEMAYDMKLVASELGVLFTAVLT